MLATECSNPPATNAVVGKTVARILAVTLRAPMHNQTARQTSTLQSTPRGRAETGSSAILLRAIWTIASLTTPNTPGLRLRHQPEQQRPCRTEARGIEAPAHGRGDQKGRMPRFLDKPESYCLPSEIFKPDQY